jgi:hypothetical protein
LKSDPHRGHHRTKQLLRFTASEAGLAVDLRHEGLGAIAALMAPAKPQVA